VNGGNQAMLLALLQPENELTLQELYQGEGSEGGLAESFLHDATKVTNLQHTLVPHCEHFSPHILVGKWFCVSYSLRTVSHIQVSGLILVLGLINFVRKCSKLIKPGRISSQRFVYEEQASYAYCLYLYCIIYLLLDCISEPYADCCCVTTAWRS
jgi:hypothetical protein